MGDGAGQRLRAGHQNGLCERVAGSSPPRQDSGTPSRGGRHGAGGPGVAALKTPCLLLPVRGCPPSGSCPGGHRSRGDTTPHDSGHTPPGGRASWVTGTQLDQSWTRVPCENVLRPTPKREPRGKEGPRSHTHAQGSGHTSAVSRVWLKLSFLEGRVRLGDSFREAAGACRRARGLLSRVCAGGG